MMNVEDFGKNLFTILANKLIHEENLGSAEETLNISKEKPDASEKNLNISKEKLDTSEKNFITTEENVKHSDSTDDVSRSVLMLSFVYRPAFRERFHAVLQILLNSELNPTIYVRCFAKVSLKKYSPLKFLIVCSFVSEIFLFLNSLDLKGKHGYVRQTTEALNDVFHRVFKQDFPQNGWINIQKEATKIAKGFQFLKPFMDKETPNTTTASQVTKAIITDNNGSQNKQEQITESSSQQMASGNVSSNPSSQVLVNIPLLEVPILSSDGLLTNQTAYLAQNLVYTPVFPISFGTVDQNAQLSYLLQYSGDQSVTFQNQPTGLEQSFQNVVETTNPSNMESHAQKNSVARTSEDEPVPSFRTVQVTESGLIEPCAEESTIFSEQELIDADAQFWNDILSGDDSESIFEAIKKTENSKRESCVTDNSIVSEKELAEASERSGGNLYLSDCKNNEISEENGPDSEAFSKDNTSASGCNVANIPENQSEAFYPRQSSAALQDFTSNEVASSQKNDIQQAHEIEINFQTDENYLSAKVLELNLGGKKFIVRMPRDMTLIFEYNGQTPKPMQPQI